MDASHYFVSVGDQSRGPVTLEELRRLWRSGVVNRESLYWQEGMADWQPLTLLSMQLGEGAGAAAGPLVTMPPAGPLVPPAQLQPTSGMAVASLVLGISTFMFCLTGIPAIICGHIARREIRASGGRLGGDGLAMAGLVLGYLATATFVIPLILFLIAILAGFAVPFLG